MKQISYVIKDEIGLHTRPAGALVKEAMKFESQIIIRKQDKSADAKKIFNVMSLGAKLHDEIIIEVTGADETAAAAALALFLEENL